MIRVHARSGAGCGNGDGNGDVVTQDVSARSQVVVGHCMKTRHSVKDSCFNPARRASLVSARRIALILLGAVLATVALGIFTAPTPALAAPAWGITMTHANAYGLQAGECLGGKEVYVPGEPEKNCGVDPLTGSGTTFAQESGFNAYKITVTNIASATLAAGSALTCYHGSWVRDESAFAYRWLRNGSAITGAESPEYTLTSEDAGTGIQCQVSAGNGPFQSEAATTALAVAPASSSSLPVLKSEVNVTEESAVVSAGAGEECTAGEWDNATSFSYQWLRNGAPIAGATHATYTITAEDADAAIQCQVTATNPSGSVVADNVYPYPVEPTVEQEEFPAHPNEGAGPSLPIGAETSGPVTVTDRLPEGLQLAGKGEPPVSGQGWKGGPGEGKCVVVDGASAATCTTTVSLAPGASYPPITVRVRVEPTAHVGNPPSGGVVNTVAASGGGAGTAIARDPTTIAPAIPFGIQSFTTSVTESLGRPFTQAGGHPFAANATFVFNSTVDDGGILQTAGGTPKDVETELPAGFIGNPQSATKCTAAQVQQQAAIGLGNAPTACPSSAIVGFVSVVLDSTPIEHGIATLFGNKSLETYWVYNLEPSPGHPAAFGFVASAFFALNATLRSDGDYGVNLGDSESGRAGSHGLQALSLTLCSYGTTGHANEGLTLNEPATAACAAPRSGAAPFLTLPSQCTGSAPVTTLRADTYQDPAAYVLTSAYTGADLLDGAPSATESLVTGCDHLQFQPDVGFGPSPGSEGGTAQADEPTATTFVLQVPQTNEAGVNATPELKDVTVTLPEGMTVNPSAADGLQPCTYAQFGLGSTVEPAQPAACPLASQVGTVKVVTPLLETPLEGQVFIGEPECSPCDAADAEAGRIFRLFLQVRSVERGVIVKLTGHVAANPTTGRLQATFTEQPQLPFSELLLTFDGGPRAPLANPQACGTFTTTTDLKPWSASGLGGLSGMEPIAGTPDATPSSSFAVDWNGAGAACPAGLPFTPSFTGGSQTPAADASSPFSVTVGRADREQDLSRITVTTPPGLLGKIAGVEECPEPQANAGMCGPASQIGATTIGAGPGPDPFYLGGSVYLTGPYKGGPFGLSIVVPATAGPFNLGVVTVRASIAVNPSTTALTIASDPLPQFVDGVQLRLRTIHVEVNRPGFMLNPTSCAAQRVGATIAGAEGASASVSTPFEVGGCTDLPFKPTLTASTRGNASKAAGASLTVTVKSAPGEANIAKVDLQLPRQLPARDSTLKQACTEAQFDANPARCPGGSVIGMAVASTPILNVPLKGPVYLVSHGGAGFPDVEFVLQGEGVTIVLDGKTDIKKGITYSRFETVPDAPIGSFEADLNEGPHSIFGADLPASANNNMCGQMLSIPTTITAQNGKQIKQDTHLQVTGCPTNLSIESKKVRGRTTTLSVYAPAAGRLTASGKGLTSETRTYSNRGARTFTLRQKRAGKLKTKIKLSFTPSKGKKQTKTLTVEFQR
jgi:hypothetical protein